MGDEVVHHHYHHEAEGLPDSIELGTPGKDGAVKVYGNCNDPETFLKRIDVAFSLRQYALELARGGRQIKKVEALAPGITVLIENRAEDRAVLHG